MNQDRLLWCLQKAHELISSRSEEPINLDSYGNDKRGCVATNCCLSPEFNEIGLFNGREGIKQNHPYPATAHHLNFAPKALALLRLFRKIALVYQIPTTPTYVGERMEYEKIVTYDRDNGGIQFLMIVFLILINIIGIIVFFN
jgi:hypothetical protein